MNEWLSGILNIIRLGCHLQGEYVAGQILEAMNRAGNWWYYP